MQQKMNLPEPSEHEIKHSLELIEQIKQKISKKGYIDFATYMHDVLYTPNLGYYTGPLTKIGNSGDFITAPEISHLFSETISTQIKQIIQNTQDPIIFEIGAGSGTMAANILKTLNKEKSLPKAYWILEPSSDLQTRQLENIERICPELISRVKWLNQMPKEKFNGLIICNEVIDAMPVHAIKITPKGYHELGVSIDPKNKNFIWCEIQDKNRNKIILNFINNNPALKKRKHEITRLKKDDNKEFYTEINLALENWLKDITKKLNKGAAIFIDYGESEKNLYAPNKYLGSLRCFYKHRVHNDPFVYPGLQDITADVNFTQLALSAKELGFNTDGYSSQAMFLASCGISEKLTAHMNELSDRGALKLNNQMRTLLSPDQMGEKIKVLLISKNLDIKSSQFIGYHLNNAITTL